MKRREFIGLIGGAAAWPLAANAQKALRQNYRVGYLMISSREQQLDQVKAFEDGLRSLGYLIGENVFVDYRFADGQLARLPALAEDLVRSGVNVIVAGGNPPTVAVMRVSTAVPIVMPNSIDPVSAGLISSLARPGGNVTGFTMDAGDNILGKRLELLKEVLPNLSRVGILWNSDIAYNQDRLPSMMEAARTLGLTPSPVEARGSNGLEQAFGTMVKEQLQAFLLAADAVLFNYRQQIAVMALKNQLPAASGFKDFAEAGFLLTYGVDVRDLFRRSAAFVDKILKGAKPADLPVEQPTKFEFVINLKTAKALGLTVPPQLIATADLVIE